MIASGQGILPINKMAGTTLLGFSRVFGLRGTLSWPDRSDGAGELQLWYHEMGNEYLFYPIKTAGDFMWVCELMMFYNFTNTSKRGVISRSRLSARG